MEFIDVFGEGYVRLVDYMGNDLTVVNSARVSYDKRVDELEKKDEGLIKFLGREGHTSPFRHAILQWEIKAPLMVCRQHWKYVVGSSFQEGSWDSLTAWNEMSKRYVTEEPSFYIPAFDEWRSKPENSKQGSGETIDEMLGAVFTEKLINHVRDGKELYQSALDNGVAPEQARLFLPANGMYTRYYWTASLQSVAHFLNQRLAEDSQVEIQEYAKAVYELSKDKFPVALEALLDN